MCGIVGSVDLRSDHRSDREILTRMANVITHRGPDTAGYYLDDNVALGARRLSIVDLAGGNQPMYNEDRSIVLVCNGEIFNYPALRDRLVRRGHVFRTHCDIEVLVHLYEEYGPDLLNEINGQFAFALYDTRRQRLLLARDHFGINPLYYTVVDGLCLFASEIKALLQHPQVPRVLDLTGLDQILTFPGLVSPRTMFKNIHSLPSGHMILIEDGALKQQEYWDLDYPLAGELPYDQPEQHYATRLYELLSESVNARLQADVPVGLYLSGGLDSSIIAAVTRTLRPDTPLHSFSVDFVDRSLSESRYQTLMARQIGALPHSISFGWQDVAERLATMIYHCECPVYETYNTCSLALSASVHQAGMRVVLSGEGADELFAGYIGYRLDQTRRQQPDTYDLDTILEAELRESLWGDPTLFYEADYYALSAVKQALYAPDVSDAYHDFACTNEPLVNKERLKGRHPLHQRSYLDFKLRLADHLISEHGDKMALASSVEARYPFLDINIVDFARTIPPDLKLHQFVEKYILKQSVRDLVPREIIEREKFGWRAPGSVQLLKQNIEWVKDLLAPDHIRQQGLFNPKTVQRLIDQYAQPGFKLNVPFERDLLMIVLTTSLLIDQFQLTRG